MGNAFCEKLYGNDNTVKPIMQAIRRSELPHAYIIEGEEGSGKKTLAQLIISALACSSENAPCGVCESCRKISEKICPDVIYIGLEGDKKTIGVDTVRYIREDSFVTPNDLDIKAYIVTDADKMTEQAQNAFLKIFEEPSSGVYFFLLCKSSFSLLPTVKSRASVLRMQRFSDEELSEYLLKNCDAAAKMYNSDKAAFDAVIRTSDGSIGKALACFLNLGNEESLKGLQKYTLILDMLEKLVLADKSSWMVSYTKMPQKRDELYEFFSVATEAFCCMMKKKKGSSDLFINEDYDERLDELSRKLAAENILFAEKFSRELMSNMHLNTNINLTQMRFLSGIWSYVYGRR